MNCPTCNARTEVRDTRAEAVGTRRRRSCVDPKCGRVFRTLEIEVESGAMLKGPARVVAAEELDALITKLEALRRR